MNLGSIRRIYTLLEELCEALNTWSYHLDANKIMLVHKK